MAAEGSEVKRGLVGEEVARVGVEAVVEEGCYDEALAAVGGGEEGGEAVVVGDGGVGAGFQ